MTDIIDEIDALVDEQLSGYSERSGYDYNVNQDRCGHCHREWHGLKITERIESMAAQVTYDEDYRYADDDSEVLCPGSSFIGPWATKSQIERMRSSELSYLDVGWIQPQALSNPYTLDSLMRLRSEFFGRTRPNPFVQMREPGDPGIESAPWRAQDDRYMYAFPQRVILGVGPIEAERIIAREQAVRGVEAAQVIIDEGRPYRYGEDFSFADQTIPPEMQFPREGPYAASRSLNRMQHAINRLRDLGVLDEPLSVRRWLTGDPEPDTRTPQERALPRPSTTPPMWAVDAGRQRRTRTNSRRRHR